MRFEKWQALGNDYLIVERDALPFALTPERVRAAVRPRTPGSAATASSSSRRPDAAGLRRAPADLQPRRLGGRAVGQRRARGGPLPAPRAAGPTRRQFSIQTAAGEIRPTITSDDDLLASTWAARDCVARLPVGPPDGTGRGRRLRASSTCTIGNPQCAIRVADPDDARGARPGRDRPGDRARAAVPQPHERLVLDASSRPARIRARIFERGVGETSASGTGRLRRGDRPRPARRRLAGDRRARRRRARRSTSTRRCTSTSRAGRSRSTPASSAPSCWPS